MSLPPHNLQPPPYSLQPPPYSLQPPPYSLQPPPYSLQPPPYDSLYHDHRIVTGATPYINERYGQNEYPREYRSLGSMGVEIVGSNNITNQLNSEIAQKKIEFNKASGKVVLYFLASVATAIIFAIPCIILSAIVSKLFLIALPLLVLLSISFLIKMPKIFVELDNYTKQEAFSHLLNGFFKNCENPSINNQGISDVICKHYQNDILYPPHELKNYFLELKEATIIHHFMASKLITQFEEHNPRQEYFDLTFEDCYNRISTDPIKSIVRNILNNLIPKLKDELQFNCNNIEQAIDKYLNEIQPKDLHKLFNLPEIQT